MASPQKKPQVKIQLIQPQEKLGFGSLLFYVLASVFVVLYCIYLYDKSLFESESLPQLRSLNTFFDAVEKFSPFHQFIDEDLERKRTFTIKELATYDGSDPTKGPYLAFMGHVFDVRKGREHYGPGGGYSFFSGKDATRAFVTGEFDEKGLVDDVTGLSQDDYLVWL